MNVNQLLIQAFGPLISSFWWLIPLLFTIAILKTPFIKGVVGELQVNLAAKFFLDKHIYTLFKNVTLPTEDGTTQIDHVIVSRYGVFVIETKNKGAKHSESFPMEATHRLIEIDAQVPNFPHPILGFFLH